MTTMHNRRVLIVEDNAMIGEHISSIIHEAGGVPLGPVCTTEEAQDAIDNTTFAFDAAVLDLRLDGMSLHIADQFRRLGVPFVFATGSRADIPTDYGDNPVCEKPFTPFGLIEALHAAIEAQDALAAAKAQRTA
jgi:CheY-like chemotaxis protein